MKLMAVASATGRKRRLMVNSRAEITIPKPRSTCRPGRRERRAVAPPLRSSIGMTTSEKVTYRSHAISTAGKELASSFVITSARVLIRWITRAQSDGSIWAILIVVS